MKLTSYLKISEIQMSLLKLRSRPRKIVVECYGGLGNQTLAIFAALYLCNYFKAQLVINCLYTKRNESNTFDFLKIEWPYHFKLRNVKGNAFSRNAWVILDSLSFRFAMWRRFERKYLGIIREKWTPLPEPNKLVERFGQRRIYRLKGFWLQKLCIESLQSQGLFTEMRVLNPSPMLQQLIDYCNHEKPIALHLRRGDYTKNDFGQLDEVYYLDLLQKLELNKTVKVPIWIFVENEKILEQVPKLKLLVNLVVTQSTLPDPAENILLMSRCRVLILSNSSFSYVAGLTSKNEVYAPWPLRPKNRELSPGVENPKQDEVYPLHWKITPSIWIE